MADDDATGAAARLAYLQVRGRVYDCILDQGCGELVLAIIKRPDSLEKLQRFQALEILNRTVERFAEQHDLAEAASAAHVWVTLAQLCAKTVCRHLSPADPVPAPDETAVLVDFMDDPELMGILGLEAGWTPDLKRIDKNLDLKSSDEGLDL